MSGRYPSLRGRVFAITGGGQGIGYAIVTALVEQGARVSVADLDLSMVDSLMSTGSILATQLDVRDAPAVARWLEATIHEFDRVDGLVVAAGIEPDDDDAVHSISDQAWARIFAVNATGAMHALRAGVSLLLERGAGSVVVIGSPTGYYGGEVGHHAYSSSKGAVTALARVMSTEYAASNVRVNVVWPGFVDTAMNKSVLASADELAQTLSSIPLRRAGTATEIAAMALFLLSDDASYCTGGIFCVDGGLTSSF